MSGVLDRTLGILELLSLHGEGVELATVADQLNMPRSAAHRLLTDLVRCGYVRQVRDHGDYMLTTKLVSMGLSFLSRSGIVDFAQPLLDRLAEVSGELVRLSVIDGNRLTWVARAQGARQGLRYDPDMGSDAKLSCSSSGLAWMSCLTDEEALALVSQQGLGQSSEFGPNAPSSLKAVLDAVSTPFINIHAGITPKYRGVHGGYWALYHDDHADFGSTIHLVDKGVDTGRVLAHVRSVPTPEDNFSTYPVVQHLSTLPVLEAILDDLPAALASAPEIPAGTPSRQWYHPTLLQYVQGRLRGVK